MAGYQKSLDKFGEHLNANEQVLSSVFGLYEAEVLGSKIERRGILVATNSRVAFFAKKFFGHTLESLPYSKISSVETSKGMMGHSITIRTSGKDVSMKWINKGDVDGFVETVNDNIE